MVPTIITGGQSGVDRAALDMALACGLPVSGWCPKGRLAEDGPIAPTYPLNETPTADPRERTFWNVRDSDATLLLFLAHEQEAVGTTLEALETIRKPYRIIVLRTHAQNAVAETLNWLQCQHVNVLNIAGPRESTSTGVYAASCAFLKPLFTSWREG